MPGQHEHGKRRRYKYGKLLRDPDVKRWHDNLARRSKVTADVYLRRLGWFCRTRKLTPAQLAAMDRKKATSLLLDMVTELEAAGRAGSYIESIIKAVKKWMKTNEKILGEVNVDDPEDAPTLAEERSPSPEDAGRVDRGADLDAKVAISLVRQSGVRLGVLGNYEGTDGLRVGDILDMKVDNEAKKVTFTAIPAFVRVRKKLSKTRRQYLTLIGEEAERNLAEYLERRMKAGERLTSASPILRPAHVRKSFIRTTNISDKIRKAIRAAGYPWRSYIFRVFFATQLQQAESKGLVVRSYTKFWMGHRGDMLRRYTLDKNRLTDETTKDLRDAYARCEGYLETEPTGKGREDIRVQFRKQLMVVAGYTEEEVAAMDVGVLSDEDLQQKLRQRLFGALANNGNKQRVVAVSEVARYIGEGWEFVAKLDDSQAIVRLPD